MGVSRRRGAGQRTRRRRRGCRRARLRQRLDAVAIDERPIPELEVEECPDGVAAATETCTMVVEQLLDGARIDDAALARPRVEQNLARDAVPAAANPGGEWHRESHLLARQD